MKAYNDTLNSGELLCRQCAGRGRSCCQETDIYVSPGDVRRIRLQTGNENFYEFRQSSKPAYCDQSDDLQWSQFVFRKDGTRRVVRRQPNGACIFLSTDGCGLSLEVRPLVCRLFPHQYNSDGILAELDVDCPVKDLDTAQQKASNIAGFQSPDLARWHRQLYNEIHEESDGRIRIGLTYDLRSEYLAAGFGEEETAEFDRDDTIDSIENALRSLGYETDRIGNARALVTRLAAGDRWDLVFNIAEGLNGIGREAQVPAILDLYKIAYTFSDPLVMALTLHKGMTKRVVRDAGVPTADFVVVQSDEDLSKITFEPPYFVKPVAEGTGKGITPDSIVRGRQDLAAVCRRQRDAYQQAVLVEPYLSGREFTVGIIGTDSRAQVLGTIEVHLLSDAEPGVYSYVNKERCEELVEYRLVRSVDDPLAAEAEAVALQAWRVLGCRDGGRVDLRCDAQGRAYFMEVNPLAGLHPHHSDLPIIANRLGIAYEELIRRIVESALERLPATVPLTPAEAIWGRCA